MLPGVGFWLLATGGTGSIRWPCARMHAYAASSSLAGLVLAARRRPGCRCQPAGDARIRGTRRAEPLRCHGLGIRLATVGCRSRSVVFFVAASARTGGRVQADTHFDDIADAYDVQIPESRREALLDRRRPS